MANLVRSFAFMVSLRRPASTRRPLPPDGSKTDPDLLPDNLGDGGFQEVSGLDIEQDIQEYYEGGRNDGVTRRVGRAKYQNLVLKRGMFFEEKDGVNRHFWEWLQNIAAGRRPVPRYDGSIRVYPAKFSQDAQPIAQWDFIRGLPAKIVGPQLNARTGEVAIEELHIAHEGLRLVAPG